MSIPGAPTLFTAYHGTNQEFDAFEDRFLGSANPNNASRSAFFFSMGPQAASDYAYHAARTMVPQWDVHEKKVAELLARADQAMRRGNNDLYESLISELEEIEGEALHAEPAGAIVLECSLALENPMEIDAQDRSVLVDLGAVIERARAAGHDALIIREIRDTPSGMCLPDDHIAVFDAAKIEIIVRHPPISEPEMDPEPELEF